MQLARPGKPTAADACGPLAACTIISRNYLSHARVLAESFLRHEPGGRFYLLVVDGLPAGVDAGAGVHVVGPQELDLPDFFEMCFKYDVTELCTAVKPSLLSLLLNRYQEEALVYLDPDILILRPLDELKACLGSSDIVLIPHLLEPIPLDGRRPSENDILVSGAYNLGFIALRNSVETMRFLRWWGERLRDGCRVDVAHGLFVDQKWVDLVPGLFNHTSILRDETYDVAYWNLHARPIQKSGDRFLVNGRPIAFFHFSGFDPAKRETLSKHQNRIAVRKGSALADLLNLYSDLQYKSGYRESSAWGFGYSTFDNEMPVTQVLRQLYLSLDPEVRRRFGNPFQTTSPNSFLAWATTPQPRYGGLSPFLRYLYEVRPDIRATFRRVQGKDRQAFIKWARTQGAKEMGYDPRLVRDKVDGPLGQVSSAEARRESPVQRAGFAEPPRAKGINVCGYLRSEAGLGAAARGYIQAMRAAQIPVALKDISELSVNRAKDPTLTAFDAEHPYDVNVFVVNADQHFELMSHVGVEFFRGRYNIGVWAWELPQFPEEWRDRLPYYDEIWVGTSFIVGALAPIAPIPVVRIPPVLAQSAQGSRENGRRRLGVRRDEFVFLFIFDFHSYFERKNPLAVIDAFRAAFRPEEPVRLVIKCVNADSARDAFAMMRARAEGYPITIYSGYWAAEEMRDLMAACDAYASLHRSEGTGLTITDAMAAGKPVIATGWSGNADFMTDANSFPVKYKLVELQQDVGPYRAGAVWAEPSVEHAAELMRYVFENREEAKARGETAKRDIERDYSAEAVGRLIRQRLAAIEQSRHRQDMAKIPFRSSLPSTAGDDADAVASGRLTAGLNAPVVPPMDTSTSLYGPLGRFVKRVVSFLLSYHTYYQRNVNLSFSAFMRELASAHAELGKRVDHLASRIDALEQDIQLTKERTDALNHAAALTQEQVARLDALEQGIKLIRDQSEHIASLRQDIARLDNRLAARPYMARDVYGAYGDLSKPMGYGLDGGVQPSCGPTGFADLFRGSEEAIAERQRPYLPFFEGRKDVVDLGCGRGEFLGLLAAQGIEAVGVERDPELVEYCRRKGHKVVEGDAVAYLRGLPERSLDGIFTAQLIEHLEPDRLVELLTLARSKLRPGGVLIAETVNPESHEALKAFHVDLSHQKPIYPQALLYLCELAGFSSARIFYPLGGGFTQVNYQTAGEYAVVAGV